MEPDNEIFLDPIRIIGQGPPKAGIFADTSYGELFGPDEVSPSKAGSLLLLYALIAGGVYFAVKS